MTLLCLFVVLTLKQLQTNLEQARRWLSISRMALLKNLTKEKFVLKISKNICSSRQQRIYGLLFISETFKVNTGISPFQL